MLNSAHLKKFSNTLGHFVNVVRGNYGIVVLVNDDDDDEGHSAREHTKSRGRKSIGKEGSADGRGGWWRWL